MKHVVADSTEQQQGKCHLLLPSPALWPGGLFYCLLPSSCCLSEPPSCLLTPLRCLSHISCWSRFAHLEHHDLHLLLLLTAGSTTNIFFLRLTAGSTNNIFFLLLTAGSTNNIFFLLLTAGSTTNIFFLLLTAGTIMSIGMLRAISFEWMEQCIWSEQAPGKALS